MMIVTEKDIILSQWGKGLLYWKKDSKGQIVLCKKKLFIGDRLVSVDNVFRLCRQLHLNNDLSDFGFKLLARELSQSRPKSSTGLVEKGQDKLFVVDDERYKSRKDRVK